MQTSREAEKCTAEAQSTPSRQGDALPASTPLPSQSRLLGVLRASAVHIASLSRDASLMRTSSDWPARELLELVEANREHIESAWNDFFG